MAVNKDSAAAKQAANTQVSNHSKEDNSLMLSPLTKEDIPTDPLGNLEEEQNTEVLFVNNTTTGFLEGVNSGSLLLAVEFPLLEDLPKKTQDPCGSYSKRII